MPLLNVAPRLFCRKPPSVTAQGSVEHGAGATPYAEIQHPTEARVYQVINSGITVLNIATRTAPTVVGTVTDAVGIIGNQAIGGLAWDSTGRYLYATTGGTDLKTFDLGAALVDKDDPNLVSTVAISAGGNLHVLNRIGSNLYILSDSANNFQVVSISTPSAPSVTSTDSATTIALACQTGFVFPGGLYIFYPAGDTSGKIGTVTIASPADQLVIQLPTLGGLQIKPGGVAFDPAEDAKIAVLCNFLNGTINHYFWMVIQATVGSGTVNATVFTETVSGGVIASLQAPMVCSSPKLAFFSGFSWDDGNDVMHLAAAIRDDSFAELGELRFYAWGNDGDYSRVPRFSGAASIPGSYSLRARNEGTNKTEWLSVGISADRSNAILALAVSDLLKSAPNYTADWFEFQDDLVAKTFEYGISGSGPRDRVASTGTLEFELDNSEVNVTSNLGGYSPDSATPVTVLFQDGSPVILTMNTGAGDKIAFYGTVSKIEPEPGRYEEKRAHLRVVCTDGIEALATTNVDTLPLRSGITTEEALRILWDRVPYLVGTEVLKFDAADGNFVHDYVFDRGYDEKTKVIGEIHKLLAVSQGFFFYRHHDAGGMTYVSLDTYKKASLFFNGVAPVLTDTLLRQMEPEREVSNIYNSVTVRYYPRRVDAAATTVLFSTQERPLIKAGQTITFDAEYRDPAGLASRVGGTEMVFPVVGYPTANTDFNFRSKKNGTGTNLNSQCSASAELGATGARIVAANAGPLPGYFFTQLRGKGVYTQEPLEVTVRDADSITKYGFRELIYDAPYIGNAQDARLLAEAILEAHKSPRTFIPSLGFALDSGAVSVACALMGPSRKLGAQETVTGLVAAEYWALGTGALDDTSGSNNAKLYGLDVYSVQHVKMKIESQGRAQCELKIVPEDMTFRPPGWIDPKLDWTSGEVMFPNLLNLLIRNPANALFRVLLRQTADVAKTNTTFSDLTGLSGEIKAGETWVFFVGSFLASNATANAKYTVAVTDVNGGTGGTYAHGRFGLWSYGIPVSVGNSTTFGNPVNFTVADGVETTAILTCTITAVVDCVVKVQGAQNSASGTTTFRQNSFLAAFRLEGESGVHAGIPLWTDPKSWAKGETGTAALLNTHLRDIQKYLWFLTAKQTADLTKNANITVANLAGMSFPVLSGEVWAFAAVCFTSGSAAADIKFNMTGPAGTTGRWGIAGPGVPLTRGSSTTYESPFQECAMTVSSTLTMALVFGWLTAGADGTIQVQAAQNTSDATDTVFYQNSFLVALRLGA
jgi:hypothetical protein